MDEGVSSNVGREMRQGFDNVVDVTSRGVAGGVVGGVAAANTGATAECVAGGVN